MTDDERAERDIMLLANEKGKFAIQVGYVMGESRQVALERLQEREWVRLIDVTPIAESNGAVMRIFILTEPALAWLRKSAS